MRRILVSFFFFTLSLSFVSVVHARTFIGNGGQGVLIPGNENKIFVRDLYSLNVHEAPLPEVSADQFIRNKIESNVGPNSFLPLGDLTKQLTAINESYPGLGDYLASSINTLSWVLVDQPLEAIDDQSELDPIQLPSGASLFQLANRFQSTVRINKEGWSKLDSRNQTALIIHEAVFHLLRPICNWTKGTCLQPDDLVRETTGLLFRNEASAKLTLELLSKRLAIPAEVRSLSELRAARSWSTTFGGELFEIDVTPLTAGQLRNHVAFLCEKLSDRLKDSGRHTLLVASALTRRPYFLLSSQYFVNKDKSETQEHLRVILQKTAEMTIQKSVGGSKCELAFETIVREAVADSI